MNRILTHIGTLFCLACLFAMASASLTQAEELPYSLNVYGAKLTSNHWEEFFTESSQLNFIDSKLLAISLAKRIGGYQNLLSYEVEGQIVKHDGLQQHWEFNALGTVRWEPFWWDRSLETSAAFGLGPSFATEKPRAEVMNEGDSQQWMLFWMMELALNLPQQPNWALIGRIHHRSEGYGLVADEGGSNALALGLKYRF